MVFGIDSHKRSLCVCAVDELGRERAAGEFANDPAGHRALARWAAGVEPGGRCFGIEGTGHHAYALARVLVASGERVLEVPPAMADRERRRSRHGKSDPTDALAIARVAARERERLEPLRHDPAARDLKLVGDYRQQLVAERTRTANRLHADLMQLRPGYHQRVSDLRHGSLPAARRVLRGERSLQGELARRRLAALVRLDAEIIECERRIRELLSASGTTLTDLPGVGIIVAARILGEVRDVRRFGTRDLRQRHRPDPRLLR
jgi:transposase